MVEEELISLPYFVVLGDRSSVELSNVSIVKKWKN